MPPSKVSTRKKKVLAAPDPIEMREKQKDDAAIALIRGIDVLMTYASAAGLGVAERALTSAKETIVYWAAEQNFYESKQEHFIHQQMSRSVLSLFSVLPQFMAAGDAGINDELVRHLLLDTLAAPQRAN